MNGCLRTVPSSVNEICLGVGLWAKGCFAHQSRLARHKMKMAKTTVRKQIYILSVCLSVVERQWLFACSKLSAMDGVACLLPFVN